MALITGGLSLLGVVLTNINSARSMSAKLDRQQAIFDTKLEELTREVRLHNNFAQRMPAVEEHLQMVDHRLDNLERRTEG